MSWKHALDEPGTAGVSLTGPAEVSQLVRSMVDEVLNLKADFTQIKENRESENFYKPMSSHENSTNELLKIRDMSPEQVLRLLREKSLSLL